MASQKLMPKLGPLFRAYCREIEKIYATGQATEHSYRPALQKLIQEIGGKEVQAVNEPKQSAFGIPDFIVKRGDVPVGHIECKDVDGGLDAVENHEQLLRYRDGLPNLILTDYLEFRWYSEGEQHLKARLASPKGADKIAFDPSGAEQVGELFDAFFAADPPPVGNPLELAEQMAGKARMLRGGIEDVLAEEGGSGPLHDLQTDYQEVLIPDLSPAQFADLQAQTAVYGLFAARCLHKRAQAGAFTRQSATFVETTPFLRNVFGHIAGPESPRKIAWIVEDLAQLLDRADMEAILSAFGRRDRRDDPVVHFYEDFLAAYDPALRKVRGVYYTPEPVVSYIVRSVDLLLRKRFGIRDGLADTGKRKYKTYTGERRSCSRVLILDPAVGTGTFLCEVVARIRETVEKKGLGGAWPDYVKDHLLERLFGFELLMAPYAICHLKLALALGIGVGIGETNGGFKMPSDQRLGVFLTNALEEAHREAAGALFGHEIVREAASADSVKRDLPVMVVLGNPPYSGHSSNQGVWIKELLRGQVRERVGSYFNENGRPLQERNLKWLNDDYVKFIRFAQWKIERTGQGVLGFVTNHSYLDNPTFRGMRQSLMKTFDEIYLLDLHGNTKKKESPPGGGKDENVFDIQQGVAIGLFVKRKDGDDAPAKVFHADLWGRREEGQDGGQDGGKYGWLAANDVETTDWTALSPKPPLHLFVPRDEALNDEYEAGMKITDVFPVHSVGIATARDKLAIQWTKEDMRRVASDFAKLPEQEARNRYDLGPDARDWKVSLAQEDLRSHPDADKHIAPILYRPFDNRYTYYTGKSRGFICMPRQKVMRNMLVGSNLALLTVRSIEMAGGWKHVFISRTLAQLHAAALKESNYFFPLYLYENEGTDQQRKTNINAEFIEKFSSATNLDFMPEGSGDSETSFGPEDLLHYVYAVLHSPEYRSRYADFLKSDFPRVPLPKDRELFAALVGLGRRLADLHLLEAEADDAPAFPHEGDNRVDKVRYVEPADGAPGQVWINNDQYFEGVAPDAWAFTIGGYRPAEKWLKDRKGRTLSFDDVAHYRRVCAALAETPRVMARIDEEVAAHGGWPLNGESGGE